MSDLDALASAYAIFLASAAAVLSRARGPRRAIDWPRAQLPRLRRVVARTLLVLAGFILAVVALRHRAEPRALACLGSAALVVGVIAWIAERDRPLSRRSRHASRR